MEILDYKVSNLKIQRLESLVHVILKLGISIANCKTRKFKILQLISRSRNFAEILRPASSKFGNSAETTKYKIKTYLFIYSFI